MGNEGLVCVVVVFDVQLQKLIRLQTLMHRSWSTRCFSCSAHSVRQTIWQSMVAMPMMHLQCSGSVSEGTHTLLTGLMLANSNDTLRMGRSDFVPLLLLLASQQIRQMTIHVR